MRKLRKVFTALVVSLTLGTIACSSPIGPDHTAGPNTCEGEETECYTVGPNT